MRYVREEIYELIPNRYPFMFIDSLELNGDSAVGMLNLTDDIWFFSCHYPDNPVMPLSLLMEAMTQTFSATFLQKTDKKEIPVISSVSGGDHGIKMTESVIPGDNLEMKAELISFRRGIAKGNCKAYKNGQSTPIMELNIVEALPSLMVKMS